MIEHNKSGLLAIASAAILLSIVGCWSASKNDVVTYTALDSQFSEPVFQAFTAETGVDVRPKFDTESTKTVGLANAILAEAKRPRCDLFWNNEILNTLRLQKAGLLEAYNPPAAKKFPAAFRSPDGLWHGFAARARVLIVNTDLLPEGQRPSSILDLADPKWRGQAAMAKPLFGTTATHAACLFSVWGDEKAKEFFKKVKANDTQILAGNKQVALSVAAGRVAWGMTDTDDAIIELEAGRPVAIVYPDQGEGGANADTPNADTLGTLFIPNTVAIIKGSPNPQQARRLVDFLLSPQVEKMLAAGPSAQIPLNPEVETSTRVKTPAQIKPMQVDFNQAAEKWDAAAKFLRDEFATGS